MSQSTLTSKGQITIPSEVRKALDLHEGDKIVFEVEIEDGKPVASLRRAPDFLAMAGTIPPRKPVPKTWAEERRLAIEEAVRRKP